MIVIQLLIIALVPILVFILKSTLLITTWVAVNIAHVMFGCAASLMKVGELVNWAKGEANDER